MSVHHDLKNQEFTLTRDGHSAELAYSRPTPEIIDFTHTFVDQALRGQGVGEELARAALAYARQQGLTVKTTCIFMTGYVKRHPEEV